MGVVIIEVVKCVFWGLMVLARVLLWGGRCTERQGYCPIEGALGHTQS